MSLNWLRASATVVAILALVAGIGAWPQKNVLASNEIFVPPNFHIREHFAPINVGRTVLNVIDFGADPSGVNYSTAAINAAIGACDHTHGCEIHFPPGDYLIGTPAPMMSAAIPLTEAEPITLSGAGPSSSILTLQVPSTYPLIGGPSSGQLNGFAIHDLGFSQPSNPMYGVFIDIPVTHDAAFYNLAFNNPYDTITLGENTNKTSLVTNVDIHGITAQSVNHCFLSLAGGTGDIFVRHAYAQGSSVNSEGVCVPHAPSPSFTPSPCATPSPTATPTSGPPTPTPTPVNTVCPLAPTGSGVSFMSDITLTGFGRGLPFEEYQWLFKTSYFSNIHVDTTNGGPAFELMAIPKGSPGGNNDVRNIRITNSTFDSSSTACILYGQIQEIKVSGTTCNGGIPAYLPTPCPTTTPYPHGETYILVGKAGNPGHISVTIIPPAPSPSVVFTYSPAPGNTSPATVASAIAMQINSSSLVTASCPILLPIDAIGPLLPIRSYIWDTGSDTPSVSVTSSGLVSVVNPPTGATNTFSPPDALRVDGPLPNVPMLSSLTSSAFSGASGGAGVHLYNGMNLTLADDRMNSEGGNADYYGLLFDQAGTFANIIANGNDLSGNTVPVMYATPLTGVSLANNAGFNPVRFIPTPNPTQSCGATITNPYPFAVDVNLNDGSNTMTVTKAGVDVAPPGTSYAAVYLAVGQSYTITTCSATPPTALWFGR